MEFTLKSLFRPLNWVTVICAIILDQISKSIIVHKIPLFPITRIHVLPFFEIVHAENSGAAWGMFHESSPSFRLIFFSIVTVVCLVVLIRWLGMTDVKEKFLRFSLALILGGAFGNVIDRVRFGHVTDFLDFFWHDHHFPAFNIADSCITVGTTLLILRLLILESKRKKSSVNAEAQNAPTKQRKS